MMSCVVVDNIERLLYYGPIGPRYSNLTLQVNLLCFLLALKKSTRTHLMSNMKESDAFPKDDLAKLAAKLSGRKASVGVKKLLGLIDMVKQTDPRSRVMKLLSKLEPPYYPSE